jgi:hypothetical protein
MITVVSETEAWQDRPTRLVEHRRPLREQYTTRGSCIVVLLVYSQIHFPVLTWRASGTRYDPGSLTVYPVIRRTNNKVSLSYVTTDGQSICRSSCQAPIWGPRPYFSFHCQTVAGLLTLGALSDERTYVCIVYNCLRPSAEQSFPCPTRPVTKFYRLRFESAPTCRARSPYLYPPGTGWPSCAPRHWGPFSSPPTIRRGTVEVFEPASMRVDNKLFSSLFIYLMNEQFINNYWV